MKFNIERKGNGIYLAVFESQYDLAMTFVRMQEFYESPSRKIRGKYFTLETYIDYWSENFGFGVFDYPRRWNGFNVPGKVIEDFWDIYNYEENDIREKEAEFLMKLWKIIEKDGFELEDIYLIGGHIEDGGKKLNETVDHETAHALYSLNKDYKRKCNKLLKSLDPELYAKYEETLLVMGYSKKTLKDELQAYLATNGTDDRIEGDVRFATLYNGFLKKS